MHKIVVIHTFECSLQNVQLRLIIGTTTIVCFVFALCKSPRKTQFQRAGIIWSKRAWRASDLPKLLTFP